MKKFIFYLIAAIVLFYLLVVISAQSTVKGAGNPNSGFVPVTLCHASPTGAGNSGPAKSYETITVDNAGQLNGHTNHPNDLIPAPEGGCPVPEVVDVCSNLEGVQEETPEGYVNDDGVCTPEEEEVDACLNIEGFQEVIPQGYHFEEEVGCVIDTPEPGPEPTRVETPLTEAGAPVCSEVAPAKIPNIFVVNAGVGKLEVRWIPTGGEFAHIFYGAEAGKPEHSLINTPNDGVEVIGALNSGQHYWFSVVNGGGCAWSSLSDWFDPIVE